MDKPDKKDGGGAKRKLDGQSTAGNAAKKVKPLKNGQVIHLNAGAIYRVKSPESGNFHIKAGATGTFRLMATGLNIRDNQRVQIFPPPDVDIPAGAEVELRDTLNNGSTLTIILGSSALPRDQAPIQIVGVVDHSIVIHGTRSAVVTANGGFLVFSGTGTVTVEGPLQGIQHNGTGTVKVTGNVTNGIRQTGRGVIKITGDVSGAIYNTGGGSIDGIGRYMGDRTITNTNGRVWIRSNAGGVSSSHYSCSKSSSWPWPF